MKLEVIKTKLQTTDNIPSVLDWKLEQIQEKNLPISALADYIVLGLNGFDDDIQKIDNYIEQLKATKEQLKQDRQKASAECAKYLRTNGIDKIEAGLEDISSITIAKGKGCTTKTVEKFSCNLTPLEQKKYLVEQGLARFEYDVVEVEATEETIKINKKKK